jgi:hypothetical protein
MEDPVLTEQIKKELNKRFKSVDDDILNYLLGMYKDD